MIKTSLSRFKFSRTIAFLSLTFVLVGSAILVTGCSSKGYTKASKNSAKSENGDSDKIQEESTIPASILQDKEITTLSDDIYSYQIKIDDMILGFPNTLAFLSSKGFTTTDDVTAMLEPDNYSYATLQLEDLQASVGFFNGGIDAVKISECMIGTFDLDEEALNSQKKIVLPKNLEFGTATKEDILAAYGNYSQIRENEEYITLIYNKAYYEQVSLKIARSTNTLCGVSIQNIQENEQLNDSQIKTVTAEPTKEVLAYAAPKELGDDFLAFNVEFAGDLYHIPAPVSVFIENGWTIDEKESDAVIKAGSYGFATLIKNEQSLKTIVENPSDIATTIENSFVTILLGDDNSTKVAIRIPKEIERGMQKGDLMVALSGTKFVHKDAENHEYYTLKDRESNNYIQITLRKDTDTVQAIELSNTTKP